MTNPATKISGLILPVARAETTTAATASGVEIRELAEVHDLMAVASLFESIWQPGDGAQLVSAELLRAMVAAGNYVAGVYHGDDLLGACFGFFGSPGKGSLHSHIAGIAPHGVGRGIGFALKLHQRAWALHQDVSRITWTFDPLVRRNAYFNLAKLAARPTCYLRDFYGPMDDGINGSGDTDRLMVEWELDSPAVNAASRCEPAKVDAAVLRARGAALALSVTSGGAPRAGSPDSPIVLVAVPADIEELRRTDPALGREWRVAVREVLSGLMSAEARVVGFDRAGWYVVSREPSS